MAAQGNTSQASLPTAAANQLSMASPSPPIPIPFRFLDLTNEVKEIILRLVLVSEHPLEPTESEHNNFQFGVPVADLGHQGYQTADDGGMLDDHLALSLTCKTIYNASLRIYFGQNEFLLRSPWELERDESTTIPFLSAIGSERRTCLKRITFDLVGDHWDVDRSLFLIRQCHKLQFLHIVLDSATRQWKGKDIVEILNLTKLKMMRGLQDVRVTKDASIDKPKKAGEKVVIDLAALDTTELEELLKMYMCRDGVVRSEKDEDELGKQVWQGRLRSEVQEL